MIKIQIKLDIKLSKTTFLKLNTKKLTVTNPLIIKNLQKCNKIFTYNCLTSKIIKINKIITLILIVK